MSDGVGFGETWGAKSWGGGLGIGFNFIDAQALKENIIRVEFSENFYFTGLFDPGDASVNSNWTVTAVGGTTGISGDIARDVNVVFVELSGEDDGVFGADQGRFLNVVLDRPLTSWPAQYQLSWSNIFSQDLLSTSSGTFQVAATYRQLEVPQIQVPTPSRDIANPQTLSAAQSSIPVPTLSIALGTFGVDDRGDYALDEGDVNLKKRILRRLMTRKNAFAHLPGYGVGVPDRIKTLGTAAALASLRADAEAQIAQEPDVQQVRVLILIPSNAPNLVRLRIAVKTKVGKPVAFDASFQREAA